MSWPPDPDEVAEHDRKAHAEREREGHAYNGKPPEEPERPS